MVKILFVVESPGKIEKIKSILGSDYIVKASVGHFRDLDPTPKKGISVDIENNFEPIYVILKKDVVNNLTECMKKADVLYIAADEDREGEAIGQSLFDVLKPRKYKRIRFNAITKDAILTAIKNAGELNKDLVDAQKARRIIDRLFGYIISPVLGKKIGKGLSAGRVQSVAVRIVVDRENEIKKFMENNADSTFYKINGIFDNLKANLYSKNKPVHIPLVDGDNPDAKIIIFLKRCLKSIFTISDVSDKESIRSPVAPFTTSTLQQEANRKLGFSIDSTMMSAQKLYEAGLITYMRTDSVEISEEGHTEIKKVIISEYGKEFYQRNNYKTKSANAQEAHEAIRPVYPEKIDVSDDIQDPSQIKLYKLIWQRTIASQMKQAKLNITTIKISISTYDENNYDPLYYFISQLEKVIFPGFMKVYTESVDDIDENESINKDYSGKIPKIGSKIVMKNITAKQEYSRPPPRFTPASLVKTLEKMGVGRPATYVQTIKTIMERKYIENGNVTGVKKNINIYSICSDSDGKIIKQIDMKETNLMVGQDKNKIIPTELGTIVNEFLMKYFADLLDYKFTADMEKELDEISNGEKDWHKVVKKFYNKMKPLVDIANQTESISKQNERILGTDPDGNEIIASKNKNGSFVKKVIDDKPIYAQIDLPLKLESITLDDAIKLFAYPKDIGKHNGKMMTLNKGKFGIYLKYNDKSYPIPKEMIENTIDKTAAIKIITEKDSNNLAEYEYNGGIAVVRKGQYGPYLLYKKNKKQTIHKIPENVDVEKLSDDQLKDIITQKKYTKPNNTNNTDKTKKIGGSKSNKKIISKKPVKKPVKKIPAKK